MKGYFANEYGPDQVQNIEDQRVSDLIADSVDAITFIMHLEEKTGQDIPLAAVGPALTGMTFRELAGELWRLLHAGGGTGPIARPEPPATEQGVPGAGASGLC